MIGVVGDPSQGPVISEFFELFKTPWEFYRDGRRYEVVLCLGDRESEHEGVKLVLIYAGRFLSSENPNKVRMARHDKHNRLLSYRGTPIPIYGEVVTFPQESNDLLLDEETREPAAYLDARGGTIRARIGYDLFSEVGTLLTKGQPPDHAGIPTLDLHIALLRDVIIASGALLAEIPPSPSGYPFIACLTHDVDHPSIRRHKFDHTMFGFLWRAIFVSLVNMLRKRASVSDLLRNWAAVLKLPLVYLGFSKDFWFRFQDYTKIEKGVPSSFFVIPFKGRAGQGVRGPAPSRRAAGYGAADIADQIHNLAVAGCEIGLHGIDAWRDASSAHEELEEIRRITGAREVGVRMHWLYFDEQSAGNLDRAGATYDSTIGYNEAVGYRAGTTQAYKPLRANRLLELPLHIMDTALFYRGRLNLPPQEAKRQVANIIDHADRLGGAITINWHDRSIAPERQWGRFYEDVLHDLRRNRPWFSTAAQTVAWFRKRRSVVFENINCQTHMLHVKAAVSADDEVPGVQLRIYNMPGSRPVTPVGAFASAATVNIDLNHSIDTRIHFETVLSGDSSNTQTQPNVPSLSHLHG